MEIGPSYEVLIVGAGPVGLTMAASLAADGILALVIDSAEGPSGLCRAVAIQSRTLEVFEQLGIIDEALRRGLVPKAANLYYGGPEPRRIPISVQPRDGWPFPYVLSLDQSVTEELLTALLQRLGGRVHWGVELHHAQQDGDRVLAAMSSNGQEWSVSAKFAIGCDGAHSLIRREAGIAFSGGQIPYAFVLADAEVDSSLAPDEIHRFTVGQEGLVVWPISGTGRMLVTGPAELGAIGDLPGADGTAASGMPACADVQQVWDRVVPVPGQVHRARWLARYDVHARVAATYRHGRLFIAGDAAHVFPTTGGQGLNTGIQDARNLAWKLAQVCRAGAAGRLLDSYEEERRPVALEALKTSQTVFRSATGGSEWSRERVAHALSQIDITYRQSSIVGNGTPTPGAPWPLRAGDRLPDCLVQPDGWAEQVRMFTLLSATRHTLLALNVPGGEAPARLAGDHLASCASRQLPAWVLRVAEPDILHLAQDALVLVRPDGYIAMVCEPASPAELWRYVESFAARGSRGTTDGLPAPSPTGKVPRARR